MGYFLHFLPHEYLLIKNTFYTVKTVLPVYEIYELMNKKWKTLYMTE